MVMFQNGKYPQWLLCFFCTFTLSSQNLVKNPSFEQLVTCPQRLGNFNADVEIWSTPTEGSTDYFNGCSTAMGTPENFNGSQPADFGTGYAGLYLYAPEDYREYLQGELKAPLEKGKTYRVSFFISLAERSDFAIKEFGVLFAKDKLEINIKKELSKKHLYQQKENDYNYMEIGYANFYSDTQDWVLVNTQFIAKGTERFMIMGNFKNNARTRLFKTKRNAKQGAYYYVDMVSVKSDEVGFPHEKIAVKDLQDKKRVFELNKNHVFEDVLFTFDKFQLLVAARQELKNIHDYLSANTELQIAINGHTDSIGSESYNKALSSKRAEAVANYLLQMGLAKNRIVWQGFGGEKPIISNATAEGRKQNRRVEFIISRPVTNH